MWQKVALILMGLGVLVLIGWWGKAFFLDDKVDLLVKIAIGAIVAGILILIVVAVNDGLAKAKTEDFREVEK